MVEQKRQSAEEAFARLFPIPERKEAVIELVKSASEIFGVNKILAIGVGDESSNLPYLFIISEKDQMGMPRIEVEEGILKAIDEICGNNRKVQDLLGKLTIITDDMLSETYKEQSYTLWEKPENITFVG